MHASRGRPAYPGPRDMAGRRGEAGEDGPRAHRHPWPSAACLEAVAGQGGAAPPPVIAAPRPFAWGAGITVACRRPRCSRTTATASRRVALARGTRGKRHGYCAGRGGGIVAPVLAVSSRETLAGRNPPRPPCSPGARGRPRATFARPGVLARLRRDARPSGAWRARRTIARNGVRRASRGSWLIPGAPCTMDVALLPHGWDELTSIPAALEAVGRGQLRHPRRHAPSSRLAILAAVGRVHRSSSWRRRSPRIDVRGRRVIALEGVAARQRPLALRRACHWPGGGRSCLHRGPRRWRHASSRSRRWRRTASVGSREVLGETAGNPHVRAQSRWCSSTRRCPRRCGWTRR